jgi:ribulose-phosphate 3-epimerase
MEIYPSLIESNLLNIEKTLNQFDQLANGYHLDIMDDHFVPNLTWGPMFINAIVHATKRPLQIHLMVDKPASWLDRLELRASDTFMFHFEATQDPFTIKNLIEKVRAKNWQVGLVINPETQTHIILSYLSMLDTILIMTVLPGMSGQKFINEITIKIAQIVEYKTKMKLPLMICVDGGINKENINTLTKIGVNRCAIAHAIFSNKNPAQAIKSLIVSTQKGLL